MHPHAPWHMCGMYKCTYVCMIHTYTYVFIYMCVCACMYMCARMQTCVFINARMYVGACMSMYVCQRMFVCSYPPSPPPPACPGLGNSCIIHVIAKYRFIFINIFDIIPIFIFTNGVPVTGSVTT